MNKNNEMALCNCCGQWFSYNGFNGIIVKRRGMHRPRYYCGFCIKEHQISKSNEKETTNEHTKCKEI